MVTAIIILAALNIMEVVCIAFLIVMLRLSYEEIRNASAVEPISIKDEAIDPIELEINWGVEQE